MSGRYHLATRRALLLHVIEQRGYPHTYLLMHPRVGQEQIEAILDDLWLELSGRSLREQEPSSHG